MSRVIDFLHIIEKLKTTKRTGWVNNGINQPESIADHMHRMGVMAMLIDDGEVDRNRCVKMAIVHDLAESVVGDITPEEPVTKEEKYTLEKNAMTDFVNMLGETPIAREMLELWEEYEQAKSKEALLVKDLDKFEMIVQAMEYEKRDGKDLSGFFESTKGKFRHPTVLEWVDALYEERSKYRAAPP